MQQSIGELIRQLRRQNNLTQAELGGERFSKSYVSAVEHSKLIASDEALRYFAQKLGLPEDYFLTFVQAAEPPGSAAIVQRNGNSGRGFIGNDEFISLLDMVLDYTDWHALSSPPNLPELSAQALSAFPPLQQAQYWFLQGKRHSEEQNFLEAQQAFERALFLASSRLQAVILDELGNLFSHRRLYYVALSYHLRALAATKKEEVENTGLLCRCSLHCASDYQALGAYEEAVAHYEQARQFFNASYNMKTAALLYLGLGYSTYAAIQKRSSLFTPVLQRVRREEQEQAFQRAISFVLQGRSVYQVSSDRIGEMQARLLLARILFDLCQSRYTDKRSFTNSQGLLDDAEEQCRQILLLYSDLPKNPQCEPALLDGILHSALAYQIRILLQRGVEIYNQGYTETAYREFATCYTLCQQLLQAFTASALSADTLRIFSVSSRNSVREQSLSLPDFSEEQQEKAATLRSHISRAEVYSTLGAFCEQLGRMVVSNESYASECYQQADNFFRLGLSAARAAVEEGLYDSGYLMRHYNQYVTLLHERARQVDAFSQETEQQIIATLQAAVWDIQRTGSLPTFV